jgi:AraC family transcriptional regulator
VHELRCICTNSRGRFAVPDFEDLPVRVGSEPPLASSSADWLGLPVSLHRLPDRQEVRDIGSHTAGIAVALSGRGKRRGQVGQRWHDLYTSPQMVEIWGAGAGWDRFQFDGEVGQVISVELSPSATARWLRDRLKGLVLQARHEHFDERLVNLIQMLWAAAQRPSSISNLYAEGLSMSLLGLLLGEYVVNQDNDVAAGRFTRSQRDRLLEFVDAEIGGKLTVERLSQVVGMSPYHFSRVFKASFGESPYAYVLGRRIEAACFALKSTPTLSVASVALSQGFYSQQHFTEAFKRKIGTTPSQWRAAT